MNARAIAAAHGRHGPAWIGPVLLLVLFVSTLAQPLTGKTWHRPDSHSSLPHVAGSAALTFNNTGGQEVTALPVTDALSLRAATEPAFLSGRPEAEPLGHPPR